MEELFNELISIVTDRLSDLTDTINIDDIMKTANSANVLQGRDALKPSIREKINYIGHRRH